MNKKLSAPRGLREIVHRYRGIILDLFGTVHDGVRLFPGALDALNILRQNDIRVCFLSNSPRRRLEVAIRLAQMGVGPELYCGLVTSGELTFEDLSHKDRAILGRNYIHIGPTELEGLLLGSERFKVPTISSADFVLCTGVSGTISDIASLLADARNRDLVMVCANPDRRVIINDKVVECAGAIAERYQGLNGTVRYYGKPQRAAYDRAFSSLDLPAQQILAIGDALDTDIAGANSAGVDVALVLTGIHHAELTDQDAVRLKRRKLDALCLEKNLTITWILHAFSYER